MSSATEHLRTRLRANTACRIVGLDPSKLNEAISRGVYRCAPQTSPGSVRVFDAAAMLPLYFFARLIDFKIPATWAGPVACDAAKYIAKREAEGAVDDIVMLIGERNPVAFGGSHPTLVEWMPASEYDRNRGRQGRYGEIGRVIFSLTFEIKTIREIIADMLHHELDQFLSGKSGPL